MHDTTSIRGRILLVGPGSLRGIGPALAPYGVRPLEGADDDDLTGIEQITNAELARLFGSQARTVEGRKLYFAPRPEWWILGKPGPAYQALLDHVVMEGPSLDPIWTAEDGSALIAWAGLGKERVMLVGVNVVEEIVRYRQGDPERVTNGAATSAYGFDFERPMYLYEKQLVAGMRTVPWADALGFLLAETWSRLTGFPLIAPLPRGSSGAVALTGDDDQAWLETYDEQVQLLGDFPITYFLHPLTRHTPETLAKLPSSVEIGVHPDALDTPAEYPARCREHTELVRRLSGAPTRVVRNHGFLSDGYLGHLPAWDSTGLDLDSNLPGIDGTALNGSFLPARVRRPDGRWSAHWTLVTAFGDGMLPVLNLTDEQAALRVEGLALQIEGTWPGVMCLNMHPQNIATTRAIHRAVMRVGVRPGWIPVGLATYTEWLKIVDRVRLLRDRQGIAVSTPGHVRDLALRIPGAKRFTVRQLPPIDGTYRLPE